MTRSLAVKNFKKRQDLIEEIRSRKLRTRGKDTGGKDSWGERQAQPRPRCFTCLIRVVLTDQGCPTSPCFPRTHHHPLPKTWSLWEAGKYQKWSKFRTNDSLGLWKMREWHTPHSTNKLIRENSVGMGVFLNNQFVVYQKNSEAQIDKFEKCFQEWTSPWRSSGCLKRKQVEKQWKLLWMKGPQKPQNFYR